VLLLQHTQLIERRQQFRRIAIHAIRTGARQFLFTVSAAQQTDAEHSRTSRRENVPHGIADDVTFQRRDTETLLAREKKIGRGFRSDNDPAVNDNDIVSDAERLK
jgi:hypothetical protein